MYIYDQHLFNQRLIKLVTQIHSKHFHILDGDIEF